MDARPAIDVDELESLCRQLAPIDTAGLAIYVLADLPADRTPPDCEGWVTPALDLLAHDVIGSRWSGRGPCIGLNPSAILNACAEPDDFADRVRAIVLHEWCHCLTDGTVWYRTAPDAEPEMTPARLADARFFAQPIERDSEPLTAERDEAHGPAFLRVACHLLHRAERLGISRADLMPRIITTDGRRPRYAGASEYRRALGGELDRMAGCSFADILATETPPALVSLWLSELGGE